MAGFAICICGLELYAQNIVERIEIRTGKELIDIDTNLQIIVEGRPIFQVNC